VVGLDNLFFMHAYEDFKVSEKNIYLVAPLILDFAE
jgi:hypothetical protein